MVNPTAKGWTVRRHQQGCWVPESWLVPGGDGKHTPHCSIREWDVYSHHLGVPGRRAFHIQSRFKQLSSHVSKFSREITRRWDVPLGRAGDVWTQPGGSELLSLDP